MTMPMMAMPTTIFGYGMTGELQVPMRVVNSEMKGERPGSPRAARDPMNHMEARMGMRCMRPLMSFIMRVWLRP